MPPVSWYGPLSRNGEPPSAPYYIYLSRWQRRPMTQVWPLPPPRPHRLPLPPTARAPSPNDPSQSRPGGSSLAQGTFWCILPHRCAYG
jgi:hypothetical protein